MQPQAFAQLPKQQLVLTDAVQQMRQSSSFSVKAHIGWRQPIYAKGQSVQINLGPYFGSQASSSGFINLSIDRYIHARAEFDFLCFAKSNDAQTEQAGYEVVSATYLKQYRKTVSKKILLMDHPDQSIMLFFTPIEDIQEGAEISIL